MNLRFLKDLFLKLASLEDEIAKLNLSPEIIEVLHSLPPNLQPFLFSKIKKNPSVSIDVINQWKQEISSEMERKQKLKEQSLDPDILEIANNISNPNIIHWWINIVNKKQKFLENLKKDNAFNKQELIESLKKIEHFYLELPENKIYNYQNRDYTIELSQIPFNELSKLANHWHQSIQQLPKKTVTLNSANIVYTFPNNYFIIELKTKEELQSEGNILFHCVGLPESGYIEGVAEGSLRIFSLRTSSNIPLITMETDPDIFHFKQMFGRNNSQPNNEEMEYINLWKLSLHPKDKIIGLVKSENIKDRISAILFMDYKDPEYAEIIDKIIAIAEPSTEEFISSGYSTNDPRSEFQALAQNTTLSPELYELIYKRDSNSISTKYGLITNNSIGEGLFRRLLSEKDPKIIRICLSSRRISNYPEYIIKAAENERNLRAILNNPSISSSITRKLIKQYSPENLFEHTLNFDPKFLNDWIEVFKNNPEKMVLALNGSNVRREDLITITKTLGVSIGLTDSDTDIILKIYSSGNSNLVSMLDRDIIAKNPNTPIEIMRKLANDENSDVRLELARNPNLPIELMWKLANDENSDVRLELAENPNLPIELMWKLSDESNVRIYLATNPNLPIELMHKLFEAAAINTIEKYRIRNSLALNPNLPIEIMLKLIERDSFSHKETIAKNPNIPIEIMWKLSDDKDGLIRQNLARNPNLPIEIMQKLFEDKNVKSSLALNPNLPIEIMQKLSEEENFNIIVNLAQNPNLPIELMQKLDHDIDNEHIRKILASNPNIPIELMQKLANDENSDVRAAIARNPNIPIELMWKLSEDEYGDVRDNLEENPNLPIEILQKFIKNHNSKDAKTRLYLLSFNKKANSKYDKLLKFAIKYCYSIPI